MHLSGKLPTVLAETMDNVFDLNKPSQGNKADDLQRAKMGMATYIEKCR